MLSKLVALTLPFSTTALAMTLPAADTISGEAQDENEGAAGAPPQTPPQTNGRRAIGPPGARASMPYVSFGTYLLSDAQAETATYAALQASSSFLWVRIPVH